MTEAALFIKEKPIVPNSNGNGKSPKLVTWSEFERKYLDREDGYKYEWNNGVITKSPTMRAKQWYIVKNLERFLTRLNLEGKTDCLFMQEGDIFLKTGKHKKPDLALVTEAQIDEAETTNNALPRLVIELVSETDKAVDVPTKVKDYFEGGVEMVWYIYPDSKMVYIYDKNSKFIILASGDDLCSATSIADGFVLSANEIFKKSVKK